jgi:hypothetical protein
VTDERVPFAGTYHGHDEIRRLLRDQQEVFGQLTMEPYEFFETGDQFVAFVASGPGATQAARRS